MDKRSAGILVHVTSLPGPFGIGDLGPASVRFLDWAAEAGFGVWQVLPLGPPGLGDSPYTALSTHAGNPALISPRRLVHCGWLPPSALARAPRGHGDRVKFGAVRRWKERLLRRSFKHFGRHASPGARRRLEDFVSAQEQSPWLEDWALFAAMKVAHTGEPWTAWPAPLRRRRPAALRDAARELADEIAFQRFVQFVFHDQWSALRRAAAARGIRLLGDLPFYVAHDSVDVWAHQQLFELDAQGHPRQSAGVPPDYFSETGQRWGHPLYDWKRLRADGFRWFIERVRGNLRLVDLLRLDHFRGFAAYWAVDAGAPTAEHGQWIEGPGKAFFTALRRELGALPLLAEDLGVITEDVHALRRSVGLPGMRVLQFGLGQPDSEHHPAAVPRDCAVYTGTHDNDTTRGWFDSLDAEDRAAVLDDLRTSAETLVEAVIESAYRSPAELAVVPLQDLLGLGSSARMNLPGAAAGHWGWRAPRAGLTLRLAARMRSLAAASSRLAGHQGAGETRRRRRKGTD